MSMPPLSPKRECIRTLYLMRNTRDKRLRAIVRKAIHEDVRAVRHG